MSWVRVGFGTGLGREGVVGLVFCYDFIRVGFELGEVRVRLVFGNRMLIELVPGGFSYLINCEKLLGFRNMQEKV